MADASSLSATIAELQYRGRVTPDDVLNLRQLVFADGRVSLEEAEALIRLDETLQNCPSEWSDLFVEALADYVVFQQAPIGYVSEENADWLISHVSQDGLVRTQTELEMLIQVMDKGVCVPKKLSAFALEQVEQAVLQGAGPLAHGGTLEPGAVGAADVELLRRILYSFGSDGNVAITRAEAEVLLRINDATANAQNDPAWEDLFVKAMANCLMAASGYSVPSRQEALRRDTWLNAPAEGVGGFMSRMLSGVMAAYQQPDDEELWAQRNASWTLNAEGNALISEDEATWLAERIGRDGQIHGNEKALLAYLKQEAPMMHPALRKLAEKAA